MLISSKITKKKLEREILEENYRGLVGQLELPQLKLRQGAETIPGWSGRAIVYGSNQGVI